MKHVVIYTDGACKGNPGPGGWGAFLTFGEHEKVLYGGELLTTNNQMELMAVIKALESLKENCKVSLYLDSQYVRQGITEWIHAWKLKGSNSPGRANQNLLWLALQTHRRRHRHSLRIRDSPNSRASVRIATVQNHRPYFPILQMLLTHPNGTCLHLIGCKCPSRFRR